MRLLTTLCLAFICCWPPTGHTAPSTKPLARPLVGSAHAVPPKKIVEPQRLVLRHTLTGAALDTLATLVLRFNDAEAQRKDGGRLTIEDSSTVADKARLPHVAIFDQDEAMAVFDGRPRFLPLHRVMQAAGQRFDAQQFYPQMSDAVEDLAGKMQALPLGMSLPVLFFNKAAFIKAGLDSESPPKTWWELQHAAGVLREAGWQCPLTSSRFAWVHLENVAAQHGEAAVMQIGQRGQLTLNNLVNVKHLSLLTSWSKSLYFVYSGPGREGDDKFARGECAMLTGESALYARLRQQTAPFEVGIGVLPHYDDVYGVQPLHVLPDGLALWVLAADTQTQRQIIARFIDFLLRAEHQREWVRATGYLPMTPAAVQALRESGGNPALLDQVGKRLSMRQRDGRVKDGVGKSRVRHILNEEVAFVWGGEKPPKTALDTAVLRAGTVLAPGGDDSRR